MIAWFVHLAPFGAWSILQHLGLIAPYAPVPTRDFCAWFFSMPGYQHTSLWTAFTHQSWTSLAHALLRWPLFWFFANSMSKFVLDYFLFTKIRPCFVEWVDAEAAAARMVLHGRSGPRIGLLHNGGGAQPRMVNWWTATRGWLVRKLFYRPVSTSELFSHVYTEQQRQQQQTHSLNPLAPSVTLEVTETAMAADGTASTGQANAAGGEASQQPMAVPEDGESAGVSPVEPPVSGVRVAHHRGDHPGSAMLEVEVSRARQALMHAATSPNSNSNVGGATLQHHAQPRLGALDPPVCVSTYPVLSYSSRLSETIATLLTLPLETYMVRVLVRSYLETTQSRMQVPIAPPVPWPFRWSEPRPELFGTTYLLQPFSRQWVLNMWGWQAIDAVISFGLCEIVCQVAWWYAQRQTRRGRTSLWSPAVLRDL